jgi:hypothetical protein
MTQAGNSVNEEMVAARRSFLAASVLLFGAACGGGGSSGGTSSSTPPSSPSSPSLPPLSNAPAWLVRVAAGQWVEIAGSSFAQLGPSMTKPPATWSGSNNDIIDAWNGLAVDRRNSTLWSCWNGGHDNIWDNSVNSLTLETDRPAWTRQLAASDWRLVQQSSDRYTDGRPASSHSYTSLQCIEAANRVVRFGVGAASIQGARTHDCASYRLDTNREEAADTIPVLPFNPVETPWTVVAEPGTGDVYVAYGRTIYKLSAGASAWQDVGGPTITNFKGLGMAAAVDSRRRRALFVGGSPTGIYSPCVPSVFDLASHQMSNIALGGSRSTALSFDYGPGIDYVPDLDLFLARTPDAGGQILSIHPQTFAVEPWTTTGGTSIPAAPQGVFTRFRYLPNLRGLIYVPSYAANAWFLRTS